MDALLQYVADSPLIAFTILLLVILTLPPIFERLRLPGLVGLLFAGVVLGPSGLTLLSPETETMKLLADIGKIYLMFVAGLEIDLAEFRRTKARSLGFGAATFLVPLLTGTAMGLAFNFGPNASILIGSLLASHTLLAYPIVQRLGVVRNEAITVTIGATIFTDIAALLVLAICIAVNQGDFSIATLITNLGLLAIYSAMVLFGLDWAGNLYFRHSGDQESNQFLFVLLAVFLAALGAELINVDKIVGAFLAGLAVNDVVGRGPVEEKVQFVGGTLFIPFFFVGMGLLLNVPALLESLTTNLGLTLALIFSLIGSKFLASLVVKLLYRYNWYETLSMWSLSLPQVAATLAAASSGLRAGLLTDEVFNGVIVLMLVTSILGPLLTERFAVRLSPDPIAFGGKTPEIVPPNNWGQAALMARLNPLDETDPQRSLTPLDRSFTVVVPIANPITEQSLIELAATLARPENGRVMPLAITKAQIHMDEPQLTTTIQRSRLLLQRAVEVAESFQVEAQSRLRIDDDIAEGISRAAREVQANLIVMGWSETGLRSRLFGTVTDSVLWTTHCPVAIARLLDSPSRIQRILVPVKILTPLAIQVLQFVQRLAAANQAKVLVVHISDPRTTREQRAQVEHQLTAILSQEAAAGGAADMTVRIVPHDDPAQVIADFSQSADLVVLRSIRRRTAGGLAVSDVTEQVLQLVTCSIILFGEPYSEA